jgi:hypothetical protein
MSRSIVYLSRRQLTNALSALLCLAAMALFPVAANAQSEGPFGKFLGTWRGLGKVTMTDGKSEKIRCTATYSAASKGQSLSQTLVCASDSYRVDIHSFIVAEGQSAQGHWEESTRQANGHLDGRFVGGQFEGTISGPGFEALLFLVATGVRQTILITPSGGSVSRVQIALSRGE